MSTSTGQRAADAPPPARLAGHILQAASAAAGVDRHVLESAVELALTKDVSFVRPQGMSVNSLSPARCVR